MTGSKPRKLQDRRPGEIYKMTYVFIFPNGDQKVVGDMNLVHPLPIEMPKFTFLRGRPECALDLARKGECSWKDHNGVRHVVKIELIKETKY